LLLQDAAGNWCYNLDNGIKANWPALENAFRQRYEDTDIFRWRKATELLQRAQGPSESVDVYITAVRKQAKSVGVNGKQERYMIQHGLRGLSDILAHVIRAQTTTTDGVLHAARVAKAAASITMTSRTTSGDVQLTKVIADVATN